MQCSGWYSITTTNAIFEIQKGVSLIHLGELEQKTHNPLENVAYFVLSDLFQDIVLIKSSCFLKVKANCANAGLTFFWRIRLRQPVSSYTPITIIRRISWAGLSVNRIYFYYHFFARTVFRQLLTLQLKIKKKIQ